MPVFLIVIDSFGSPAFGKKIGPELQAAGCEVRGAEVGDDGEAEALGDDGGLAGLPCGACARAEIVCGKHAGHQIGQPVFALQNPQQQRNFQADENTDQPDQRVERHAEMRYLAEHQKQDCR